jgi:signal transduction histidine kinase
MRLADQFRTTTFLLTLRYMVLFFVSVSILVSFINWSVTGFVEQEADTAIRADIQSLREQYESRGPNGLARLITARIRNNPENDALYLLIGPTVNNKTGNLRRWPKDAPTDVGWATFEHNTGDGERMLVRARVLFPQNNLRLLVGRKVSALDQLNRLFDSTLLWGMGVTLALAMFGGLLMSRNVMRRVNSINATSRQIMQGDLSRRIHTDADRDRSGDEFDELAVNLNEMLDQIENLMISMQHISDNVAHDLRTPLTRLRNRLEELRRDASPNQIDDIDSCLDDADGLLATFTSLLSIARIESGTYDSHPDLFNIGQCARDAYELYTALADDKSISLTCDAPEEANVRGDRNLIFQALTNLLDNAIKYTPAGGSVSVAISDNPDSTILTVSDSGPGIPDDMREKVLQRFFRLDKSRSEPGAGLGLSLV